jgi:hypothetical protein
MPVRIWFHLSYLISSVSRWLPSSSLYNLQTYTCLPATQLKLLAYYFPTCNAAYQPACLYVNVHGGEAEVVESTVHAGDLGWGGRMAYKCSAGNCVRWFLPFPLWHIMCFVSQSPWTGREIETQPPSSHTKRLCLRNTHQINEERMSQGLGDFRAQPAKMRPFTTSTGFFSEFDQL